MANTVLMKAPASAGQVVVTGPLNSGQTYTIDASGFALVDPRDVPELLRAGFLLAAQQLNYRDNLTASTDPGVNNDTTADYGPGSLWLNTSTMRAWMCISNSAGAAAWALDGVQPGVGIGPSSMLTYFGGGTAAFPEEGNINRQISSAGINPGATGADNVLAVFSRDRIFRVGLADLLLANRDKSSPIEINAAYTFDNTIVFVHYPGESVYILDADKKTLTKLKVTFNTVNTIALSGNDKQAFAIIGYNEPFELVHIDITSGQSRNGDFRALAKELDAAGFKSGAWNFRSSLGGRMIVSDDKQAAFITLL